MYLPAVDDYLLFRLYTNRFDAITHGNIHITIYVMLLPYGEKQRNHVSAVKQLYLLVLVKAAPMENIISQCHIR